jgi:hypothetical protein
MFGLGIPSNGWLNVASFKVKENSFPIMDKDDLAYRLLDIPTSKDKLPLYAELNKLFCACTEPQIIKNTNTRHFKV